MTMRPIFRGFCINRFGIGPSQYISSRSDFGFEFGEIFIIEKRLPHLESLGVANSPNWRVGESQILRLGESGSHWLSDTASRGGVVGYWMFKKKSPHRWVEESSPRLGESATPLVGESGSRWLPDSATPIPDSPSRGVAMVSQGVAIQIFWKYHRFTEL
jgi:hypothetical protein